MTNYTFIHFTYIFNVFSVRRGYLQFYGTLVLYTFIILSLPDDEPYCVSKLIDNNIYILHESGVFLTVTTCHFIYTRVMISP